MRGNSNPAGWSFMVFAVVETGTLKGRNAACSQICGVLLENERNRQHTNPLPFDLAFEFL